MSADEPTLRDLKRLLSADFEAHYGHGPKGAGALVRAVLAIPPLQAVLLVRLCQLSPRPLWLVWHHVLMIKHAMHVGHRVDIGPGLNLPHPIGIVLGSSASIGRNVTIYQHVTVGHFKGKWARIGDDVTLFTGCVVLGEIAVGRGATIGANAVVRQDVPEKSVFGVAPGRLLER